MYLGLYVIKLKKKQVELLSNFFFNEFWSFLSFYNVSSFSWMLFPWDMGILSKWILVSIMLIYQSVMHGLANASRTKSTVFNSWVQFDNHKYKKGNHKSLLLIILVNLKSTLKKSHSSHLETPKSRSPSPPSLFPHHIVFTFNSIGRSLFLHL